MKLDFQSAPGLTGALVTVPAPVMAELPAGVRRSSYGAQTILLVQDQRMIRQYMATCLENLGYNVLASPDPETALDVVQEFKGKIDLLLTDFSMPGISGPELSRMVRRGRPAIKALYMSSHPEEMVWQSEFLKHKPAWLAKPFTPRLLADGVRKALGSDRRLILILDEDREVRSFLGDVLRRNGYETFEAADSKTAGDILSQNQFHLMIGDLARFENNRGANIRDFRRLFPGTRIMVLTGKLPAVSKGLPFVRRRSRRAMEADDLKARWLRGAHATIPKPVSTELLLETVAKIFEN